MSTVAISAIRNLLLALTEAGHGTSAALAEAGIEASLVDDADSRIPLEKLHALWEAVLRRVPTADAILGAQRSAPGDYGLVGFVAMNSATLGEGLKHVVRYLGLWTDDPGIDARDDGTVAIVYRARFADRPGVRLSTEATLAEILQGARLLTQTTITPLEVRFAHDAPPDLSRHETFFGCPVRFAQASSAMVLRREDLALPLPKADAQLGNFLRQNANAALERRVGADPSPLDRLREILAEELQKGVPSLEHVAKRMATSDRTLRRRLEENGTSFRALLDETRAELARSYVRDRRLPLSEVAFLLGFSEPSAFHRAFKRWTDTTPAAWRASG